MRPTWGFPKIGSTFLGVPIIRTIVFLGLHRGSPYLGKLPRSPVAIPTWSHLILRVDKATASASLVLAEALAQEKPSTEPNLAWGGLRCPPSPEPCLNLGVWRFPKNRA